MVGGIVGARLYFIAQNDPLGYLQQPLAILRVWEGGLAFYGSVMVVPVVFWWLARRHRVSFWGAADLLALGTTLGMAVGRIGDVLIGEHYGPLTSLPWGITYTTPGAERPPLGVRVQSGSLYEVLADAAIFVALYVALPRLERRPGLLFALALGAFALSRIIIFSIVQDVPRLALGLNNAQWTSIGALAISMTILAIRWPAAQDQPPLVRTQPEG